MGPKAKKQQLKDINETFHRKTYDDARSIKKHGALHRLRAFLLVDPQLGRYRQLIVSAAFDVAGLLYARLLCWPTRLMDGDSCIVICSAGSGEELARLNSEDLLTVAKTGGIPVRALKQALTDSMQLTRFRQRLLNQDTGELLQDDMVLSPPMNIQLVKLEFLPSDDGREDEFTFACEEGLVDEVERILQGPQDPNDPNLLFDVPFEDDYTPLHVAAEQGYVEIVHLLLEAGADKDNAGRRGTTALHLAAQHGRLEIVHLLLDSGADKEKLTFRGETALHYAARNGHSEVVNLFLESGADKEKLAFGGETALHLAVMNGHSEVVRLLLESGAGKDKLTRAK